MRTLEVVILAALLTACSREEPSASAIRSDAIVNPPMVKTNAPPGVYTLDPARTQVTFVVEYVNLTKVSARFPEVEGSLQLDPDKPEGSVLAVTADARAIQAAPGIAPVMQSADFLDADRNPEIAFRSTRIMRTGPATADITGDLTVRGQTRPVTLKAMLTGVTTPPPGEAGTARINFTATGAIQRGRFAMDAMMPFAGDPAGVLDEVDVRIEASFVKDVRQAMAALNEGKAASASK